MLYAWVGLRICWILRAVRVSSKPAIIPISCRPPCRLEGSRYGLNRPSFLDAFGARCVLPFELDRRRHSAPCVLPGGVVEHFDIVEHVPARFIPRAVDLAADSLSLVQDTEASTHGADRKQPAMLGDERVLHFASLAKYAAAFFGCRAPPSRAAARASAAAPRRLVRHHGPRRQACRTASSIYRASTC